MLNDAEKSILFTLAHEAVESTIFNTKLIEPELKQKILSEPAGAFVTLYVHNQLRGCIGFVQPVYSLARTVQIAASKAASEDFRFPPINKAELSDLKIRISVIGEKRSMQNINDIIIGEDGIMIEYGASHGLLLPQVAIEWKWDREEFLDATCHKARLVKGTWKKQNAEVILFKTENFGDQSDKNVNQLEHENENE